jgi:hypothetical protein
LFLLFCLATALFPHPASASAAWVADWDLPGGLREIKQGDFKDIIMFAAYFTGEDQPFLTSAMKTFLAGDTSKYLSGDQNLYISVVNDYIDASGKSAQKDPKLVKRLMATERSRARHREDLLNLLKSGPFTGLEIDYEKVDLDDWPKLLAFADDLCQRLATMGKKMRFVLEPKEKYLKTSLPAGPQYVLMAYNLYGTHSGPGPKADHDFLRKLAGWCEHLPVKPGLALAGGGFAWLPGKVVALTESKASAWAKGGRSEPLRDPGSGSLRFYSAGNVPGSPLPAMDITGDKCEIWYADGRTLADWAVSAQKYGFGEISIWRLGGNTRESLKVMAESIP